MDPLVVEDLAKSYGDTPALDGVSFRVRKGEFVSIMGPSGCGKTTLLNLIAGIELPTRGRVFVAGKEVFALDDDGRSDLRLEHIGFVFQSFNLLPGFTAIENVAAPLELRGLGLHEARARAAEMLEQVEIAPSLHDRFPAQLSGGEQQRVAIARALVGEPDLLLADEPTGALDSRTAREILNVLATLSVKKNLTVLMATHDTSVALLGSRILELRDGRIVQEVAREPREAAQILPFPRPR